METLTGLGGINHNIIIMILVVIFVGHMLIKAAQRIISKIIIFILCMSIAGGNIGVSKYFSPQKLNMQQAHEFALMDNASREKFQEKFDVIKKDGEVYVIEKLSDGFFAGIQQRIIKRMKTDGKSKE